VSLLMVALGVYSYITIPVRMVPRIPTPNLGVVTKFPGMSAEDMDRYIVSTALERADYNMSAAARTLGTTRQTLRYRAQKYGLSDGKS
jgi:multidrug efflux pump subunit AcrB